MPQPLQAPPPLAPLPFPPDARTQEMIKEKLQKAEELGKRCYIFVIFINGNMRKSTLYVPYVTACIVGELGMLDEAQRAMEEADALKKVKWVLLMCF